MLHGVLSETHYNQHAGTNVERDFVEAPSQIYEEWTRRLESLATHARCLPGLPGHGRGDGRPAERRAPVRRRHAVRAAAPVRVVRHGALRRAAAGRRSRRGRRWRRRTTLGFVPGTNFPATFSHIAGGYAAGYYGYMWAEVIALDMLSAFGGSLMNPRGRHAASGGEILSRGGEEPAGVLVERFLGRPVNNEAFLKEITGQR